MLNPRFVNLRGKRTASLAQCLAAVPSDAPARRTTLIYLRELSRAAHWAGLDLAVLVAQAAHETGDPATGKPFQSEVMRRYRNYVGMKTRDASDYIKFPGGKTAARAHACHMCAYVYGDTDKWPPKARRFLVKYLPWAQRFSIAVELGGGSVGHLGHLGNGLWAEDPHYADGIARHLAAIYRADELPPIAPAPSPQPPMRLALTSNKYGRPFRPTRQVYHITDDLNLDNTLSWFRNPDSGASSNYVIDRDGTIYLCVDPATGSPWTNGDERAPRRDIPSLNRDIDSGTNMNLFCITYEYVGTPAHPPTEAQYAAGIALAKWDRERFGISPHRSHQNRHADINSVSRSYCPGPRFDLARIIRALGGDPAKMDD